jgi:hypothetical protein
MRAAAVLVALGLTAGCPRLPPAPLRPHAHLSSTERDGATLTARLRIDGGGRLRPVAVDWALAVGERDLVRGRSASLTIPVGLPPEVRPGALVRLRGAVHLEGSSGDTLAPFDEAVRIPR